ncbi:MAG: hypothetical protein AYK22_00090 [Thermoplasmatales archaeon SG8-52-3]|nr:MAG: hypothetical protein AYK22_00090 [Thermoplasmatales archaeon SG8-52-3]
MKIEVSNLTYNKLKTIKENEFEGYDFDMMIKYLLTFYNQNKKNHQLFKKMEKEVENLMKLAKGT